MKKDFVSLAEARPDLAKEWNDEKNGDLKPEDVSCGSNKKVWWKLPYDVPDDYPVEHLRGKHFEFEWEAKINNRVNKRGCPYLTGRAVWKGFNDLQTVNPELAKQWHPTKNGNLKPTQITANSAKKIWWCLSYDVPTDYPIKSLKGKHFDFEWQSLISSRNNGIGCPYLSGQAVWEGFNDLQTVKPDLATQWHPTKNGDLKSTQVTIGTNRSVWWLLPYNVPDNYPIESLRGKHFDFEWQATIASRNKGNGCPYLSGQAVLEGFNDLQTLNPDLAAQWHPTKNGDLKPTQVTINSPKEVWWLLHYNVSIDYPIESLRGKFFDFEWKASIVNRNKGNGCPYLSGQAVWEGFNDLQTVKPDLATQWHPTKNGDLKPTQVTINSPKEVWWLLLYDDPDTRKHFNFEWKTKICNRNNGTNCPYLINKAVWTGFNDLQTINPKVAAQWHPTKNEDLKPTQVTANSEKKVWWYLPYDVPADYLIESLRGKHFDFEWKACISDRTSGCDCPYLSSKAILKGFNDLETVNPELAAQWHPTKNGDLKPTHVMANSNKKVWWLFQYDDPITGKHFDFEWKTDINSRNNGTKCPFLSGHAVWKGFNDLRTTNPEVAAQWHPTKNGDLKPTQVTANSAKKIWWCLPYDVPDDYPIKSLRGKHFDFEWKEYIYKRNNGHGCPYLSSHTVWEGFNDLQTVNPELAAQWHPTKNGDLKPTQVTANSNKKVWWILSYDDRKSGNRFEFEWKTTVNNRNNGNGCPYLSGKSVLCGFNDLQTVNPELARQWHPTKNGSLDPTQVTANSNKKVWWLFQYDDPTSGKHFDFEWISTIASRHSRNRGCPYLVIYKGEEYIKQYLQKNNISFNAQQKFSDLLGTGGGQLSYDFSISDEKHKYILIEYNGIQHYEANDYFGGEAAFKKQKEHDKRKRDYAKKHSYKLITIKYTYDTYESVEEYLDKELKKLGVVNGTKKEELVNDAA